METYGKSIITNRFESKRFVGADSSRNLFISTLAFSLYFPELNFKRADDNSMKYYRLLFQPMTSHLTWASSQRCTDMSRLPGCHLFHEGRLRQVIAGRIPKRLSGCYFGSSNLKVRDPLNYRIFTKVEPPIVV